jgi:tetratricopeptide (TPR) repeat protein
MMRARLAADHPDTGAALIALSELAHQRGDIERAAELAAEAMKARNKRPRLAHGIADLVRMGKLLLDMEEPAEAAKFFRDALDLAARARGQDHPSVGQILVLAGRVALAQEDPELALRCFSRALEIGERASGRDHRELIEVLRYVGETNLALSELEAAEAAYRRVGEIYAASYPPGTEWQAIAPALLGEVAMKRKTYGRAAELFEQALSIAERAFGVEDIRLQVMLEKAGEAQLQNGSFARAEELSLRLLALHEAAFGPESPALLPAVRRLADVYIRTKDPRTEQMVKRTMQLLETATRELNEETAMIKAETARLRGSS